MTDLILAVDQGTGGPKVGFVDVSGAILWWEHTPVATAHGPQGAATQDADEWWQAIKSSVRRGMAAGIEGSRVIAVAVTGQWASTVPVAADGTPVGPCLLWSDTAGAALSRELIGGPVAGYAPVTAATWVRRSGGIPSLSGADPLGHRLQLAGTMPETTWYLEPVDYLTMRFTGRATATHASMTASWLTDNRSLDKLDYDSILVGLARADRAKLPPLVTIGDVIGTVTSELAAELGIPSKTRVITGIPDLHSAAVGSGAVEMLRPHASIGTSAWISARVPAKKTDVIRQQASVPGLTNDSYLLANNQDSAGRSLAWYRDTLHPEATYEGLLDAAAKTAPGAGGVVFTPWLTGERSPIDDHNARAGFHNLGETTTSAHLTRAVLEGVSLNLRWLLGAAEKFTGTRMDELSLVGGGARSDLWCQITADVLDRRIVRVQDPLLATLRGAALFAGVSLGRIRWADVPNLVPTDPVFVPDPGTRAVYDRAFGEFPKLYAAQKGFFRRSNQGG